ncbi:unnamed protein product, partial [Chrysoparadoxa australica]
VVLGLSSIPWLCKVNDIYYLSKELGLVVTLQTALAGTSILLRQQGEQRRIVSACLLVVFNSVILW